MPQQQMSEEQVKALQEKIKNMSPEELKEFQKKQCIFCQIISGKVQSKKIYEDQESIAILDINPANPGHIVLLPKEHYSIMPQVPEDIIGHLSMTAKALSNVLLKSIGAQGTNIIIANGVAAGQRAQHFMIHIIPRMENDDLQFTLPQNTLPEEELEQISEKLSKSLGIIQEKSEAPPKFEMPEQKVVEAEFKEKPIVKEKISPKKETPSKKEKKASKKPAKKEEADLDDIARILGAK